MGVHGHIDLLRVASYGVWRGHMDSSRYTLVILGKLRYLT